MRKNEIELDMGGRRLTHAESGDTALRHEWMLDGRRGFDAWRDRLAAFAAAHPGCHVMRNPRGDVVDDFRRWPCNGGGYAVGEVVVSLTRFGEPDVAREVVARVAARPEHADPARHDLDHTFLLDDGTPLYWSSDNDCWYACDLDGNVTGRTRPVQATDRLDVLVPSSGRLAAIACVRLAVALREVGGEPGSYLRERFAPEDASELEAHARALSALGVEEGLADQPPPDAARVLREAADWVDERRKVGVFPRDQSAAEYVGVRRGRAIADTIERRAQAEAAPRP